MKGIIMDTDKNNGSSSSASSPDWLEELVATVGDCLMAHSLMGPLGWYAYEEDGMTELVIYPKTVIFVGGALDGELGVPGFSFDVQTVLKAFEQVDAVQWNSQGMGPHDEEGAHLSIEGIYQGHEVWVRVLAEPPEDEEPGLEIDTSDSDL
jgi:hypothetical protein